MRKQGQQKERGTVQERVSPTRALASQGQECYQSMLGQVKVRMREKDVPELSQQE